MINKNVTFNTGDRVMMKYPVVNEPLYGINGEEGTVISCKKTSGSHFVRVKYDGGREYTLYAWRFGLASIDNWQEKFNEIQTDSE